MEYQVFLDLLRKELIGRLEEGIQLRITKVRKNNAVLRDSLSIIREGENVSPSIYLEEYYRMYLAGVSVETIAERMLSCYHRRKLKGPVDMEFFTDWNRAGKRIVMRLIGHDHNLDLLGDIPHEPYLDLEKVYYYLMENFEAGSGAIMIHNAHLSIWDVTQQELDAAARENTMRLLPAEFVTMRQLMEEVLHTRLYGDEEDGAPLYVLTNESKTYGAVWMTDPGIQEDICRKLGEDYFVLPSSVHECMIVPASSGMEAETLQQMTWEINHTQVPEEEILSDTVYRYRMDRGALVMENRGPRYS